MKFLRSLLALAALASAFGQQPKNVQKNPASGVLMEGFSSNRTHSFLVGSAVTFDVGSTLTVNGIFSGTPTGGTLNLGNVTVTGAGSGDVPSTRTISTTAPLQGGGSLAANRTITIDDATTATKGAASFNATHFSVTSGAVSIANTAVTPGSYANANITVDAQGRITIVGNGVAGMGGNYTVAGNRVSSSGNVTIESGVGENIYLNAGAGGSTVLGNVNVSSANVTAFTGATANGQLIIGNVSGGFTKAVPTGGPGVDIVTGAGSLAINSTDARNFIVGATTVTTNSTGNFTFVAGDNISLTANNTTKSITINSTGGGNGTLSAGIGTLWPTATIGSPPTGFFAAGDYGTTANTALGDWSIIVASAGTVATPTADVVAGEVNSGTVVTFSSATGGLTNFRSTTNGTDPTYSVGTAGNSVTVTADNTYEVVANKQGWVTSAVASFAYTVNQIPTHSGAWTIAADGTSHTLVFSEAISFGAGSSGGFSANMSGGAVNLTYASGTGTSSLVFTGNRTVLSTETETGNKGQYTQPGNGAEDSTGQDVATFTGHTITNNSSQTGGSPTWYYSPGFNAGNGSSGYSWNHSNDSVFGGKVTLPTGTITKYSVYVLYRNAASDIKFALHDTSTFALISGTDAAAVAVPAGDGQWHDFTVSKAVSAGTYYVTAIISGASGNIQGTALTMTAGDGLADYSATYAGYPTLVAAGAMGTSVAFRVEVTP